MPISVIRTLFIFLVIACILIVHSFLAASDQKAYQKAFWRKGAAGLCFIAAGILTGPLCRDHRFAALTVTGLILGLAGDQLLALRFIYPHKSNCFFAAGGSAFAIGHILYFFALFHTGSIRLAVLLPAAAAGLAVSILYGRIKKTDGGSMKILLTGYMALLSVVNACAWGAAAGSSSLGLLVFAVGTLFFLVSDNILFAYCFSPRSTRGMYRAVHVTYYTAQLCIGAGMGLLL